MATYYVDADNGNDTNDGLGTGSGNAWATINKFADASRSAGDKCIVRRGTTATVDDGSVILPISDGAKGNPIIIEADYDDAWTDFANSAQTYTLTFGSKTATASATITGISAGDWVYNTTDGDDPREFAYEVANVSGTTLTLYLPFKGSTGATKTLKVMPANPIHGDTSTFSTISMNNNHHWKFQGIDWYSASDSWAVQNASGLVIKDCAFVGDNGVADYAFQNVANRTVFISIEKSRSATFGGGFLLMPGQNGFINISDCYINGGNLGVDSLSGRIVDTEFDSVTTAFSDIENNAEVENIKFTSVTTNVDVDEDLDFRQFGITDYNNTPGDTRFFGIWSTTNGVYLQSETTKVRAGGSNTSLKVTPPTSLSTVDRIYAMKILEIPIYASTSSKTYTVYFASDTTTEWTTGPTASELWIELEAWGHASNNYRKITKSTGTVDFTTDTNFDQTLTVTVAPAQAGVAYLRVWYAKPKESTKTNVFYVDPIPEIT